jgi:NADH/NAD ratio-sensing transcriptional regulator Rex
MGSLARINGIYQLMKALKLYGTYYGEIKSTIRNVLHYYVDKKDYNVAIWGAGLKGKAFLKVIDPNQRFVKYVYDRDEKKFGSFMPTGHAVVDYQRKENQDVQVVLIMNNNYETEIAGSLSYQGMSVILVNVDSIKTGRLTPREIIKTYGRKLR